MEIVPVWFLKGGHAVTSFEVLDDDLRTSLFVNWGDASVSKMGKLDSGPALLNAQETARIKAYCDGSARTSCEVDFAFHDAQGRLLKQSRMTLAPGTAGFLDLEFEETHSMNRQVTIIPSLTVSGAPAVGGFALLDDASGRMIAQSYPAALESAGRQP